MRVVRSGKSKKPKVIRRIECQNCESEIEIQSGGERNLKLVSDWRDGDYYELKCPECRVVNNIDASLFR